MNDARIIDFLNGRPCAVVAGAVLALTSLVAATSGIVPPPDAGQGVFFDIKGTLVGDATISASANVATIVATAMLVLLLNKLYNFVKSVTMVGATAYFLLETATPLSTASLNTGTILALMLAVGSLVLFGNYQNKHAQRAIFSVMSVMAFGLMAHWAFVVLIAAFLLGFIYLRAMNWRGAVAAAIGLFTPFWIVLGLGLAKPSDFNTIEFDPLWNNVDLSQLRLMVSWVIVTVVMLVVLTAANLLTIYNYRLQLRVYNAFFILVATLSALAMCIDYRNVLTYMPMVNLCLSVQIAHAFTISKFPKRHIAIAALAAVCLAVCVSSLAI